LNIIITGTSGGIGFELTRLFVQHPAARVIAISRDITSLEIFSHYENFRGLSMDISESVNYLKLDHLVSNFFGSPVNILINNAGNLINKSFHECTEQDYDDIFNTNVKGVILLIHRLFPLLSNPSHIVNITSMGGFQGSVKFPGLALYSASKGALSILTECLAEEFKPAGISVNALALGAVDTPMLRKAFPGYQPPVSAEKMAAFIKEFALTGNSYFNGKIIPVSSSVP
jgi:3-oxoacyl-[acyl-carrier protein] reductase